MAAIQADSSRPARCGPTLGNAASFVAVTSAGPRMPASGSSSASRRPRPGQSPAAQKAANTGSGPPPVSGRPRGSRCAGADTSSSAATISFGSSSASLASAPVSWPSVRAPRIAAATPGRSRSQASATATGEVASPSAAVATASTMPATRGSSSSTRSGRWPTAARESAGIPPRYLPVSTPPPSGDHGNSPTPSCQAGRDDLALDAAIDEGVAHLVGDDRRAARHGPLPCGSAAQPPAAVVRHAGVARLAGAHRGVDRAQRLLERHAVVDGVDVPEVDVVGPSLTSDASNWRSSAPREASTTAPSGVRLIPALVAITRSARGTRSLEQVPEHRLGLAIAVGRGGVDERAAGIVEGDELSGGLVDIGLDTPGHRAEPEVRHLESAVTDGAQFHAEELPARRAGTRSSARYGDAMRPRRYLG